MSENSSPLLSLSLSLFLAPSSGWIKNDESFLLYKCAPFGSPSPSGVFYFAPRGAREVSSRDVESSAAVIFLVVVGSLINPKTPPVRRKVPLPKTTLFLSSKVSKKPSFDFDDAKVLFFALFSLAFVFKFVSFFLRVVGLFLSLELSLSNFLSSRFVLASPLHWYKIRFARC